MKRISPPRLAERFLLLLLSSRDRETVSGDLLEEFCEEKWRELGQLGASLWYWRQVFSFLPAKTGDVLLQGTALRLLCWFTALAAGWLAAMDLRLRHPGYLNQIGIAAGIACQAVITLSSLRFSGCIFLRAVTRGGALALLWLAGTALRADMLAAHFEGFVLLIGVALILQALLSVLALPRVRVLLEQSA